MPTFEALIRAKEEMVLKDLPPAIMKTITMDVMISLAQQHAARLFEMTDELTEQIGLFEVLCAPKHKLP